MLSVDNNYVQQNHGRDVFQYVEYHLCLAIEVWRHAEFKDDVTLVNIVYDCCSYSKNLTDPSDQSLQIVYLLLFFVTWLKELDDMHVPCYDYRNLLPIGTIMDFSPFPTIFFHLTFLSRLYNYI